MERKIKSIKDIQGLKHVFQSVFDSKKNPAKAGRIEKIRDHSENKYRRLFESMMDGCAFVNLEGRITDCNRTFQQMLGYELCELLEMYFTDITPRKWHKYEQRIITEDVMTRGYSDVYEKEYRRKNGTIIPVELSTFLFRNKNQEIEGMWAIVRDISIRKVTESALKESESNFRELFEYSPLGVSMTGLDGTINVNKAFCALLGYKQEELHLKKLEDITYVEDIPQSELISQALLEGKIPVARYEKRYLHKNGTIIWTEISTHLRRDKDNNPKFFITIISDINERKKAERTLKESELKHRIVADNTYDWEFWIDNFDRFIYCSPSCFRITGYTSDEYMANPSLYIQIIHPDDREKYNNQFREAKIFNHASETNFRIIHKNASERWIGHVCQPIYDEKGVVIGRRGSNRDITFQMKVVEEIRKSEERFRGYFEASIAGIAVTSPDMKWIEVNEYLCKILGYCRQELVQLTWAELTHPEDIYLDLKQFKRVLKGEMDGYSMDKRFIKKDGKTIWISLSVKCVRLKTGEVDYFMALLFDITEQKKIEEELAWERYLMNSLLDNIPDYIYFKDQNSRILRINKAMANVLSLENPLMAIGKTVEDLLIPKSSIEGHEDEEEIIRSGKPIIGKEEIATWTDRSTSWISSTKMPLKNASGKIIGTFGISRDITEKKRILVDLMNAKEKAEESDRLKTAFLHNISHEIRTPLNAIIGFSTFLGKPDLSDEKKREFINIINASNDQLLSIISGIIATATLEAGQVCITENETNINLLIRKVYEQLQINNNPARVILSYHNELPDELAYIYTDAVKLMQILVILVGNALKFTHKGHVKFGYHMIEAELKFFVEDTGIGIREEMHELIFKRFMQLDNTATRRYGGTGLGLALAKGYTELLGGRIILKSRLGEGATFIVTIPYKPV